MEQSSSWESNSHSASQIPRLLWNPNVHYRVHNGPPLVPVMNQMNPFDILSHCFPKIHSYSILASTSRSSEWSFPFRVSSQNILCIFISLKHVTCPSHFILLDIIPRIIFCEAYKLRSSSLYSLLLPPPLPSSEVQIFSSAPCSHTPQSMFFP